MRLAAVALASLLAACAAPTENASMNVEPDPSNSAPAAPAAPSPPKAPAPGTQQPQGSPLAPEPSGDPILRALPREVAAGGTVTLMLSNGLPERLGYNLCTSALLASDGSEVRTDRVCTLELRTLEPGRSATYPYDLPESVRAGTYRLRTQVERMGSGTRTTLISNEFTVR